MKIVKILGGLGNQMFQYALFLSLKERFPHEQVMIDTSCFRNYPLHNGFEVDRIFAQKAPVASWRNILKVAYPYPNYRFWKIGKYILPKRKTMCVERKNFSFDAAVLTRKGDCYYDGYWQHEEYFCDMKETIWEAFSFPEPVDGRNKEIGALLQASDSASLHVRRGDYVNHPLFRGICDLDYYKRAIHYMEERVNPQLYCVFSNDMAWCDFIAGEGGGVCRLEQGCGKLCGYAVDEPVPAQYHCQLFFLLVGSLAEPQSAEGGGRARKVDELTDRRPCF